MIVVVDDEVDVVNINLELLRHTFDFECVGFTNPIEAIAFIWNNGAKIKLIVTDQNMRALSGCEIIKALRVLKIKAPVIIYTGAQNDEGELSLIDFETEIGVFNKTIFVRKPSSILPDACLILHK